VQQKHPGDWGAKNRSKNMPKRIMGFTLVPVSGRVPDVGRKPVIGHVARGGQNMCSRTSIASPGWIGSAISSPDGPAKKRDMPRPSACVMISGIPAKTLFQLLQRHGRHLDLRFHPQQNVMRKITPSPCASENPQPAHTRLRSGATNAERIFAMSCRPGISIRRFRLVWRISIEMPQPGQLIAVPSLTVLHHEQVYCSSI